MNSSHIEDGVVVVVPKKSDRWHESTLIKFFLKIRKTVSILELFRTFQKHYISYKPFRALFRFFKTPKKVLNKRRGIRKIQRNIS